MALTLRTSYSARDHAHAARPIGRPRPQVDDLEAAGEQRGHVCDGEVPTYAGGGGVGGLVDAYLQHRLTLLRGVVELARVAEADL